MVEVRTQNGASQNAVRVERSRIFGTGRAAPPARASASAASGSRYVPSKWHTVQFESEEG